MPKIYESDIYHGGKWRLVADILTSLQLWNNDACALSISPATVSVSVEDANAGVDIPVELSIVSTEATPTLITFAEFTLAAAITEDIDDASIVPTIDDTTPTLVEGKKTVTISLPAAGEENTYAAGDTITLTISNYTAKDGRTITGGTCVVTITE